MKPPKQAGLDWSVNITVLLINFINPSMSPYGVTEVSHMLKCDNEYIWKVLMNILHICDFTCLRNSLYWYLILISYLASGNKQHCYKYLFLSRGNILLQINMYSLEYVCTGDCIDYFTVQWQLHSTDKANKNDMLMMRKEVNMVTQQLGFQVSMGTRLRWIDGSTGLLMLCVSLLVSIGYSVFRQA